jgi:hypothetical protein
MNQAILSFLDTATRTDVTKPIQGNRNAIKELATILSEFHTLRISTTVIRITLQLFYSQHTTNKESIEAAIQAFLGWMESLPPMDNLVVPSNTQPMSHHQFQEWVDNGRSFSSTTRLRPWLNIAMKLRSVCRIDPI